MLVLLAALAVVPTQGTLTRDGYGIPYISAASPPAAFRLAGLAVAEDRIHQMDMSRRSARGQLAEVLGSRAVASDKDALRFGYTDGEYKELFESLPPLTRNALTAYAEGVNMHIRSAGISMRPWEPIDSLAIGVNLIRQFGRGGAGEIRNLLLYTYLHDRLQGETRKAFDDLLWQNDPLSPTTSERNSPIPAASPFPKTDPGAWERHIALLPKVNMFELLPAIRLEEQSEMKELAAELGVPNKWGSYAVLVDKSRATSPMLLNGPQMGFSLPSVVHQMSIESPGYKAVGMDVPGFPGIVVGRTDKSAWGATSGVADTDDIFFVELDPNDPTRYKRNGEWKAFQVTKFTILVKGGESQSVSREMSVYGPVILKSVGTGVAYVRQSSLWMKEPKAFTAILEHIAKGAIDFDQLADENPASFNLFGLGNGISWNYCGDIPIRSPKLDPRLPIPGTGEYDWQGIVPKSQMPRQTNPRTGVIVNWNNKPVPWWPNFDTPIWGQIFRSTSILKRIPAKGKITPTDLEAIIREIALEDSAAAELVPVLAAFPVKGLEGLEATVYDTIIAWDGMMLEGSIAPVVYTTFFDFLRRELFEPKLGLMLNPSVFFLATQATLTSKALRGLTEIDYLAGRSANQVIAEAVKRTTESLKASLGEDVTKWVYRDKGISWPGLRRVLHGNRGTYIQLVVSEPTGMTGRYIAPPGVSENKESAHYSDQVARAASWSMLPMEFKSEADSRR